MPLRPPVGPALATVVFVLAFVLVLLASPREARAHYVPGDSDPGRVTYVLPGALVTPGAFSCCLDRDESAFLDIGVEVSVHRFVPNPGGSAFSQLGYGALGQVSVGGLALDDDSPRRATPGPALRVGAGVQGTFGVLGVQTGLVTRAGSATYGTSAGAFGGVFLSLLGLGSVGAEVEVPVVTVDSSGPLPVLITFPCTLKFPFAIEPETRARKNGFDLR